MVKQEKLQKRIKIIEDRQAKNSKSRAIYTVSEFIRADAIVN